jgi:DNA-binding CsgD family transcriptional regulator
VHHYQNTFRVAAFPGRAGKSERGRRGEAATTIEAPWCGSHWPRPRLNILVSAAKYEMASPLLKSASNTNGQEERTPVTNSDLPAGLRVRALDSERALVVVTFNLGRLSTLTAAERDVARLAYAGLSNDAIACLRRTSTHTVAVQIARVLRKLRVSSRLALATIPEVRV